MRIERARVKDERVLKRSMNRTSPNKRKITATVMPSLFTVRYVPGKPLPKRGRPGN